MLQPENDPPAAQSDSEVEVRLEDLIADNQPAEDHRPMWSGVVVGRLAKVDSTGAPHVDFPGNPHGNTVAARSMVVVENADAGREVALMFEQADPSRPLLMGVIQQPIIEQPTPALPVLAEADGERVVITAGREIVLKCGKASLTLTRSGKVLLRGAYVSSRSSGVNRIKGGSVQIN